MTEYIVRYENEYLQLLPDKMQELVRCKDCKWIGTAACFCKAPKDVRADWFCSEGEKKDDG